MKTSSEGSSVPAVQAEKTPLGGFLDAVAWSRHAGARYGFVAFERGGVLHNVACRLTLLPTRPRERRLCGRGHGLVIGRGWINLDDARRLFQSFDQPEVAFDGYQIQLRELESGRPYSWWRYPTLDWSVERIGWPAESLHATGSSVHKIFEPQRDSWLGDRLVSLKPDRFVGWPAVWRELGPMTERSGSDAAFVELFDPICAKIGRHRYDARRQSLTIEISCFLDPIKERLKLVASSPRGRVIEMPGRKWMRTGRASWRVELDARRVSERVVLHLVTPALTIDMSEVAVPGLAARLLDALEGGDQWLTEMLAPMGRSKDPATGFERGVVALLALGGIPAVPCGHVGRDRFVDLLACDNARDVSIIECTIASPAPKKLSDLRARAQQATARLRLGEHEPCVRACLFTPLPLERIPQEIVNEAEKLGVVFIWKERLDVLHEAARAGDLATRYWTLLDEWEPPSPDPDTLLRQLNRRRRKRI